MDTPVYDCMKGREKEIVNHKWRLKLGNCINVILYALLTCLILGLILEYLQIPLSYVFILPVFILMLLTFVMPILLLILKTEINSADLIAFHLSNIAIKLSSTREKDQKDIVRDLSQIKFEMDLIRSYHKNYRTTGQVRNPKAPFVKETEDFLDDIEKALRKISSVIKHKSELNSNLNSEHLKSHLNCLANELCLNSQEISEIARNSIDSILNDLEKFEEDNDIFKSKCEIIKSWLSLSSKRSLIIWPLIISLAILLIALVTDVIRNQTFIITVLATLFAGALATFFAGLASYVTKGQ
jgi:hypothetical protein